MSIRKDMRRYQWTFWGAVVIDFWWRLNHLPYRGGEGGLCGPLSRLGYARAKTAEGRAYRRRTGHPL